MKFYSIKFDEIEKVYVDDWSGNLLLYRCMCFEGILENFVETKWRKTARKSFSWSMKEEVVLHAWRRDARARERIGTR